MGSEPPCDRSTRCSICRDRNDCCAGELCAKCTPLVEDGRFWELTDRETVLRFNAYAHKRNFRDAVHPDDAEHITGEGFRHWPLPDAAERDQCVLVRGADNQLTLARAPRVE